MRDRDKTKAQLSEEMAALRRRVAELERAEAERVQTGETLREAYDKLEERVRERTAELEAEIAERKQREEELRLFRHLIDRSNDLVFVIDPETSQFLDVNETACRVTGYTREELLEMGVTDLEAVIPTHVSWQQRVAQVKKGGTRKEGRHKRKDGTTYTVEADSSFVTFGERDYVLAMLRDITERVRAEEKIRERTAELNERVMEVEQLNRATANLLEDLQAAKSNLEATAAKLQEVNQELADFAYVVSHDLKAPLRGITQLANWVSTDYADALDEKGRELLRLLTGRTKRMHNLIEGILQYSRVGRVREKEKPVDLNWLVQETIKMLAPPEHVRVTIKDDLPTVVGEQTRLTQVFQNLMSNGIRFLNKPEGWVIIGCADEGAHWRFSVADNGPGIEEKYHSKIFQIFQTFAPRDHVESTGIGLAVVKKIVETWGGSIWAESTVGKGSTFFFTLPKRGEGDEKE